MIPPAAIFYSFLAVAAVVHAILLAAIYRAVVGGRVDAREARARDQRLLDRLIPRPAERRPVRGFQAHHADAVEPPPPREHDAALALVVLPVDPVIYYPDGGADGDGVERERAG